MCVDCYCFSLVDTLRNTHSVGLPLTSDRPVTEAAAYTTNTKRQTSTLSAGFEFAIPAIEGPQTYALDRTACGIDIVWWLSCVEVLVTAPEGGKF